MADSVRYRSYYIPPGHFSNFFFLISESPAIKCTCFFGFKAQTSLIFAHARWHPSTNLTFCSLVKKQVHYPQVIQKCFKLRLFFFFFYYQCMSHIGGSKRPGALIFLFGVLCTTCIFYKCLQLVLQEKLSYD